MTPQFKAMIKSLVRDYISDQAEIFQLMDDPTAEFNIGAGAIKEGARHSLGEFCDEFRDAVFKELHETKISVEAEVVRSVKVDVRFDN